MVMISVRTGIMSVQKGIFLIIGVSEEWWACDSEIMFWDVEYSFCSMFCVFLRAYWGTKAKAKEKIEREGSGSEMEESNRVDALSLPTQSILFFYSPYFMDSCFLFGLVMIIHFYKIISKCCNLRNHKSQRRKKVQPFLNPTVSLSPFYRTMREWRTQCQLHFAKHTVNSSLIGRINPTFFKLINDVFQEVLFEKEGNGKLLFVFYSLFFFFLPQQSCARPLFSSFSLLSYLWAYRNN